MFRPTRVDFRRVQFGFASAETESAEEPHLLLDGFYDAEGLTASAIKGHKYLFLGYKGSGKSALGQRLRLLGETDSQLFVQTALLGEFPFSHFTRIIKSTGPAEQEAHFPSVWTWILLLHFLDSFSRDAGAELSDGLLSAIKSLRDRGLLPTGDLKLMVLKSVRGGLRGMLPEFAEASRESTYELSDSEALANVEILKGLASEFASESRHVIVIDGLDDILTQKSVQYNVLAALVLAVNSLNTLFTQRRVSAKVVLLCRTDIFARLPIPNKNKIRQDSAEDLDWYHDPREPRASGLVRLANLRARLQYPTVGDIFDEVFPRKMNGKDIRSFLAVHTRHTPRDFLRLLVNIQKYADPGRISSEAVMKGLREYSIKYFRPEMHDELVSYVSTANAEAAFAFFGSLRGREFHLAQLKALAAKNERYKALDLEGILEHLFECSAVGNSERGFFWFKFRNRDATINFADRLVFHPGLWKAFNIAELPDQ
jgi:hypothetical protein